MHDLNTIHKLNLEAHGAGIKADRASGKHVVATYAGLTLLSHETFDGLEDALAAINAPTESPDQHRVYLSPLDGFHAAARDQSEDRRVQPVEYRVGVDGALVESPVEA